MKWMRLKRFEGDGDVLINMAMCPYIYASREGGSYVVCGVAGMFHVTESPEEITRRGEWVVK